MVYRFGIFYLFFNVEDLNFYCCIVVCLQVVEMEMEESVCWRRTSARVRSERSEERGGVSEDRESWQNLYRRRRTQ